MPNPVSDRPRLILASASPRRLQLLGQVGHRAGQATSGPDRRDAAAQGAAAGARPPPRLHQGADGAAQCPARPRARERLHPRRRHGGGGRPRILPNPEFTDEAAACLRLLSGRGHRVYGALCLITPRGKVSEPHRRDAHPFQAVVARGDRHLSRLRRMGRQGRRLRDTGPRRRLRHQARRLLHECRGSRRSTRRWRCFPARATRSTTAGPIRRERRRAAAIFLAAARIIRHARQALAAEEMPGLRQAGDQGARSVLLEALRRGRPQPLAFRDVRDPGQEAGRGGG